MGLTCVRRAIPSGRPDVAVRPGSECREHDNERQQNLRDGEGMHLRHFAAGGSDVMVRNLLDI